MYRREHIIGAGKQFAGRRVGNLPPSSSSPMEKFSVAEVCLRERGASGREESLAAEVSAEK